MSKQSRDALNSLITADALNSLITETSKLIHTLTAARQSMSTVEIRDVAVNGRLETMRMRLNVQLSTLEQMQSELIASTYAARGYDDDDDDDALTEQE